MVLINLYSACRDKEIWSNAEDFVPDRFMETRPDCSSPSAAETEHDRCRNYDVASQRPATIEKERPATASFGFGKRRCVGERLSRRLLVVYLTTLVRGCYIDRAPGVASIDLSPRDHAIVLRPKSFQISVRPRSQH
jgi:cytochrome P450